MQNAGKRQRPCGRFGPLRRFACIALLLLPLSTPARSQDVDAATMAFIHDLAAPGVALPPGADADSLEAARAALKSEKLLSDRRVSTVENGVVDQ